jgi:arachidonate 15-lipoxygenase
MSQEIKTSSSLSFLFNKDNVLPNLIDLFDQNKTQKEQVPYENKDYQFELYSKLYPNIPPHIKTMPLSEKFDSRKEFDALQTLLKGFLQKFSLHDRLSDFNEWTSPEEYVKFFATSATPNFLDKLISFPVPSIALNGAWTDDLMFADQFLNGCNPVLIQCVESFIEGKLSEFFIDDNQARAKIAEITQFSTSELSSIQYFLVDHKELLNCVPQPGCVLYAPKTLLYRNHHNRLAPLAIMLRQCGVVAPSMVFYPNHPHWVWLYCKIIVGNSDANYHEVLTHLSYTHELMETLIVAANKTLPPDHSVLKLLTPHFHRTLFINNGARGTLISSDPKASFSFNQFTSLGVDGAMKLANSCFSSYSFIKHAHFLNNLTIRGMHKKSLIDRYYFADYGLSIWNAIHDYVVESLGVLYGNDLVADDVHLQQFAKVCFVEAKICDFPAIESMDDLVETVTTIIWIASAQHSAVNFNQYENYAFPPNHPLMLKLPMPSKSTSDTIVTSEFITKSLPSKETTMQMITLATLLTTRSKEDYMLQELDHNEHLLFSLHKQSKVACPHAYANFVENLREIEEAQRTRNAKEASNYTYLYPSNITASISI